MSPYLLKIDIKTGLSEYEKYLLLYVTVQTNLEKFTVFYRKHVQMALLYEQAKMF